MIFYYLHIICCTLHFGAVGLNKNSLVQGLHRIFLAGGLRFFHHLDRPLSIPGGEWVAYVFTTFFNLINTSEFKL